MDQRYFEVSPRSQGILQILWLKKYFRRQKIVQCNQMFDLIPLMVVKYEIVPNLIDIHYLYYPLIDTSMVLKYQISTQKWFVRQLGTELFASHSGQIQIYENMLLVTGGQKNEDGLDRFTVIKEDQIREFKLKISRSGHAIVFYPKKNIVFIIAGYNRPNYIRKCEAFSIPSFKGKFISDFPQNLSCFHGCQVNDVI